MTTRGWTWTRLVAFADRALAVLAHRRLEFDRADAAEPLRRGFEVHGWKAERLVKMRLASARLSAPAVAIHEVPYEAGHQLRVAWSREDAPDQGPSGFLAKMRDVALHRDAQVLAVRMKGEPVSFAQLERIGDAAEIAGVFVRPELCGQRIGTALTCAAIKAAGPVLDLWIDAEDEDRPKKLYARLGFRPVWTLMQFTRMPAGGSAV